MFHIETQARDFDAAILSGPYALPPSLATLASASTGGGSAPIRQVPGMLEYPFCVKPQIESHFALRAKLTREAR